MKRFDFVFKHYANDIKERPDGDFVKYEDVLPLIEKEKLLKQEIRDLLIKVHGHKDHPKYEISVWTWEYNKMMGKIDEALKKI